MNREFIYLRIFEKQWKELGLSEKQLEHLEIMIMKNPEIGDLIQGTGGLRKLRFPLPNRGKSGSTRVLYVDFTSHEKTILMGIYQKNSQDNITDIQKQEYKKLIQEISRIYKRR